MIDEDAPRLAADVCKSHIGSLLFSLRDTVDSLISIRVREFGPLLADEEGELLTIHNSLLWLLSDIREARIAARKLKVVS